MLVLIMFTVLLVTAFRHWLTGALNLIPQVRELSLSMFFLTHLFYNLPQILMVRSLITSYFCALPSPSPRNYSNLVQRCFDKTALANMAHAAESSLGYSADDPTLHTISFCLVSKYCWRFNNHHTGWKELVSPTEPVGVEWRITFTRKNSCCIKRCKNIPIICPPGSTTMNVLTYYLMCYGRLIRFLWILKGILSNVNKVIEN